jgi:hypothetical protein
MVESIQGKIEEKIIDWAVKGAGDRLVILKPEEGHKKADLIVEQKGDYELREYKAMGQSHTVKTQIFGSSPKKNVKKLNIFVRGEAKIAKEVTLTKEINIEELESFKNCYLLFVFFDEVRQDIGEYLCLITLEKFREIAADKKGENILKFESFLSPEKEDKFSKFLLQKKDLSQTLFHLTSHV